MRILMLDSASTRIHGGEARRYTKGQVYDIPDDVAQSWIASRTAVASAAASMTDQTDLLEKAPPTTAKSRKKGE